MTDTLRRTNGIRLGDRKISDDEDEDNDEFWYWIDKNGKVYIPTEGSFWFSNATGYKYKLERMQLFAPEES